MTDSTGAVRTRYDYDLWGRRTKINGGASDPEADFGFTGHYYHAASGMVVAPRRFYLPELGRWLSRDPIAERGGLNIYAYVRSQPILQTDKLGLADNIDIMLRNMDAIRQGMLAHEVGSAAWLKLYGLYQAVSSDLAGLLLNPPPPPPAAGTAGFASAELLAGGVAVTVAGILGWEGGTYLQDIQTSPTTTFGDDFVDTWGLDWLARKTCTWWAK